MDDIDLMSSYVQINFPGGTMISTDNIPYISTTGTFVLTDP
jgi:hypothetical protein